MVSGANAHVLRPVLQTEAVIVRTWTLSPFFSRLSEFDLLQELAENEFEGWGKFEDAPAGEGVDYDWSGVIGALSPLSANFDENSDLPCSILNRNDEGRSPLGRTSAWIGGPLRQRWTQRVRIFARLSTFTRETDNLLSSTDTEWLGRSSRPHAPGISLTPSLPLSTPAESSPLLPRSPS